MTLPEPERRKRFLAPDLFFSLGIFASFQNETRHLERLGMPFRRTAHLRTRGYSRPAGGLQARPRTGGEAENRQKSATSPAVAGCVAQARSDRKSTRLNSSHSCATRMQFSASTKKRTLT